MTDKINAIQILTILKSAEQKLNEIDADQLDAEEKNMLSGNIRKISTTILKLEAADLTVNGVPATAVDLIDGKTAVLLWIGNG